MGATVVVFSPARPVSGRHHPSQLRRVCRRVRRRDSVAHAASARGYFQDDAPETLGDRTRAALEREKTLVLRSIKELEFDRGMGKVSEKDFAEMSARLRARAARLMRQLDAGSLYREQIEKEIAQRLGKTSPHRASRYVARSSERVCSVRCSQ